MKILTVYANNKIAYEYDNGTSIDEQKLAFLDKKWMAIWIAALKFRLS